MIKANELRILNYVSTEVDEFIAIDGTNKDSVIIEGDYVSESYVNPIPLTEEWLLKFGFKSVNGMEGGIAFEISSWGRIILKNGIVVSDQYYFLDGLNTEIKYVHQLQNLYFALTGNELTIKQNDTII